MIVDTSALLAFLDLHEPAHAAVVRALESDPGPFVVSPFVLAEADYLVATRHGVPAELAMLDELASGAWDIASWSSDDLRLARSVVHRYRDQEVGLADAANVVLAARYGTATMATLDRRHVEVLRQLDGGSFDIVP